MANTTFSGPVRSQNGFESISVDSITGAVTTTATFGATTSITNLTVTGNAAIGQRFHLIQHVGLQISFSVADRFRRLQRPSTHEYRQPPNNFLAGLSNKS